MTTSAVFQFANTIAMLMWVLMILLPNWKGTRFLVDYKLVPILLSGLYIIYIVQSVQGGGSMDFSSLESVKKLFTVEIAVLAGWLHYLAFDLVVGMWILDQNRVLKINHLILVPCLLGAFIFGPVGFLLYMIVRTIRLKSVA